MTGDASSGTAANCETPACGRAGRPSRALIGLAIAYCLVSLVGFPIEDAVTRVSRLLWWMELGVLLAVPVLLATWAALGPPPAFQRMLWTTSVSVAAAYSSLVGVVFGRDGGASTRDLLPFLAIMSAFLIFTLLLVLGGGFTSLRIAHKADPTDGNRARANQFRIKDLMFAAAMVAATFGLGRCLHAFDAFEARSVWGTIWDLAEVWLVLLPAVPIVGTILALRNGHVRLAWALIVTWVVGDFLLLWALPLTRVGNHQLSEIVEVLVTSQLGFLIASYPSVMAIYAVGYRLVRRKRIS